MQFHELRQYNCLKHYDSWGLINAAGKITPFPQLARLIGRDKSGWIALRILDPKNNTAPTKLLGQKDILIPKTNEAEPVGFLSEGRAPVRFISNTESQGKERANTTLAFSYCTATGEILKAKFDQVSPFSDGVAAVRIGKAVGFIGLDGQFLQDSKMVNCQFSHGISQGYLPACVAGLWGYLDTRSNWLIEPRFDSADPFKNGMAMIRLHGASVTDKSNSIGYVDKNGKLLEQRFHSGGPFEGGYAAASILSDKNQELRWGLIDKSGQWAIEPIYTRIGPLVGSTRLLYDKDLVGFARNEKVILQPKFTSVGVFSEGIASFQTQKKGLFGFLDEFGKTTIPEQFTSVGVFSEGLAAVRTGPNKIDGEYKIGFVNRDGKMCITPRFDSSYSGDHRFTDIRMQFSGGICLILGRPYRDGKYTEKCFGYIDKSGRWITEEIITEAYPFQLGQSVVRYYPKNQKQPMFLRQ